MQENMRAAVETIKAALEALPLDQKVEALNEVRAALHEVSPFRGEPVDCVTWVAADSVEANDYNPNAVAPPEMALLHDSIKCDGYTQPIVVGAADGARVVIDGYHRNRVGKEKSDIRKRLHGYLPVVSIRTDKAGRIASTIRHNRARGAHSITGMGDIVARLVAEGRSDAWIMKHLGMDAEEVLRLKQITGLAALFKDEAFGPAWEAE